MPITISILDKIGRYSFKFLEVKTFLPATINRAHYLGLHKSPPLEILDIGTGVGYFPVICQHYGHRAMALDRDGNLVFEDVCRWLGVDRRSWEIERFQRLPDFGRKFDLITAFMANFDRLKDSNYQAWGVEEWTFFLDDLAANQLKPGGRVAMLLNEHTPQSPGVLPFFRERGARIDDGWVCLPATATEDRS